MEWNPGTIDCKPATGWYYSCTFSMEIRLTQALAGLKHSRSSFYLYKVLELW